MVPIDFYILSWLLLFLMNETNIWAWSVTGHSLHNCLVLVLNEINRLRYLHHHCTVLHIKHARGALINWIWINRSFYKKNMTLPMFKINEFWNQGLGLLCLETLPNYFLLFLISLKVQGKAWVQNRVWKISEYFPRFCPLQIFVHIIFI